MVETIMGEGGIKVVPDVCLKGLKERGMNRVIKKKDKVSTDERI